MTLVYEFQTSADLCWRERIARDDIKGRDSNKSSI